jgi:hydrogenase maturation protein HypF
MEAVYEILVRGLVQGVGFRPFIYRLASSYTLGGEVINRSDGVRIVVSCDHETVSRFADDIRRSAPPAAVIRSVEIKKTGSGRYDGFMIRSSRDLEDMVTEVSPDIAVCDECLADLDTDEGRKDYPFINCTSCGPRFTIIKALPYDRANTTMAPFEMCERCASEYHTITDRRFHAQPVACNTCGPRYTLIEDGQAVTGTGAILDRIAGRLSAGGSVALKSTGGYNLMCDALNEEAVAGLRRRKGRDMKPFAVMFRDMKALNEFCYSDKAGEDILLSWRRPILILPQRKPLAPSVSSGLDTIGAMLPHMPMHHMLFRVITTPVVVLTSGNLSDEPIIISDSEASRDLMPVTGCVVSYDRQIYNRVDDSVMRMTGDDFTIIRRSRGFAPQPVELAADAGGIFSAGAEQKSTFCIGKGRQAFMSQYIGDIKNIPTYDHYRETYRRYSSLFRFSPSGVACDMHPDYLSGLFAREMAGELGLSLAEVQHHHAHAASVMAEHGLEGKVIGVIMDGTGYGTDGNTWGSEFMVASAADFERYSHFDYIRMPGGDVAANEPWRMALSCILSCFGSDYDFRQTGLFRAVDDLSLSVVREMLAQGINSPLTCGAGRYFDAAAALLMLCTKAAFDSEAPMRLESAITGSNSDYFPFTVNGTISLDDTFRSVVGEIQGGDITAVPAKFHNTIAQVILEVCKKMRDDTSLNRVVLSGGVFQNSYLTGKATHLLSSEGFRVFRNRLVPPNDGGISLGQILVAAERRRICA